MMSVDMEMVGPAMFFAGGRYWVRGVERMGQERPERTTASRMVWVWVLEALKRLMAALVRIAGRIVPGCL